MACGPAAPPATPAPTMSPTPPTTDIFLAALTEHDGVLSVGRPSNLTRRPAGYDNQPAFVPDGSALLFSSIRDDEQADVWRVAARADATPTRVLATPESEYSPTPLPDGRGFSVVRVEPDGKQRLWRFRWDGAQPELVLPGVEPVGYHAWLDTRRVALFVLGTPHSLWLADIATQSAQRVVDDIGRSFNRAPGGGASFARREADGSGWIALVRADASVQRVAPLPQNVEGDHAWTPDGRLLTSWGDTLRVWQPERREWQPVADLASLGIRGVTRLAVSPDGGLLAIVGSAAAP